MTRTRSWKRIAGISVAAVAAVVLAAFVVAALLVDGIVADRKEQLAAELSAKLKRPVRIGDVDVTVFGGRVEVGRVELGPAEHEPRGTPAALSLERAALNVGLLRTSLSLGRRPHVESLELEGVQANVVRLPDGSLNWQDISRRLGGEQAQQPEPAAPDERSRNAVIDDARLSDATVAFVELAPGSGRGPSRVQREARISQIDLHVQDAGVRRGAVLALQAAVLDDERNLELRARARAAGAGEDRPRIRELSLQMKPTELAPLAPFFAAFAALNDADTRSTLERGVLSADLQIDGEKDEAVAEGRIALAGARFRGGEGFDARVDLDLTVNADAGRVAVRQAVFQAGEMSLHAKGTLSQLDTAPRVQGMNVRSQGLSFDRIRALYPAFDRRTAPARLRGPFSIRASGSGARDAQRAELEVSLSDAAILVRDRFEKPGGTPLELRAELAARGDAVDLSQVALQLADFRVIGRGRIQDLDGDTPRFRMAFDTPSPDAGGLVRLLPQVARALRGAREAPGKLVIEGSIEGTAERYAARGSLQLSALDVRAEGTRLAGGGNATFAVHRQGERFDVETKLDFTQLRAVYLDVIRKPEPTPFEIDAQVSGVSGRPAALRVSVPSFMVTAGRSDVRGSLKLANLDDPQVTVDARSRYLDLDDFLPGEREPEKAADEPSRLANADGVITLRVDAGRASGVEYRDLDARLRLRDGRARAEKLEVSAFEGQLSGQGSEFPLFAEGGAVRVRGSLTGMQTQGLIARFAGAEKLLRGTLGGSVDVSAAGATLEDIRKTLTGKLSGSVEHAEFGPGNGYSELAEKLQALASVKELKQTLASARERLPAEDGWELEDLKGVLRFEQGAAILKELSAQTPQGKLSVDGRLSLTAADLAGTWAVEPKALDALVGKKLGLDAPIPIELRIKGPLTRPQFAFGDIQPMLKPIVSAYAKTQLEGQAKERLGEALEETGLGDELPFGDGDKSRDKSRGESRGAKQSEDEKGDAARKAKKREPAEPADKAKREVEKRLRDVF